TILRVSHPNYTTTTIDDDTNLNLNLGAANFELQPYNVLNFVKKDRSSGSNPTCFNLIQAEKLILEKGENKEYLPVEGLAAFNKAAAELLLGADNPLLKQHKVASVQCCGGTGSLRLGAAFIERFFSGSKVLISSPTWGNHKEILDEARVAWSEYRYCDPTTMELDFEGMIADIKANIHIYIFIYHLYIYVGLITYVYILMKWMVQDAPNGCFVLLQGCAHNPTCIDPTLAQWQEIADVIQRKNHIAFFDFAYQGFASGSLDRDAESVRMFGARGMDVIVAQSYSKNLGLYAERIGALHIICSSSQTCNRVKSQLKWLVVGLYAFPPVHGARIVAAIASNPGLFKEWKDQIAAIATRTKSARKKLYKTLAAKEKTHKDWSFILHQLGMFSYTGLNKAQREYMERKWHVYMTKDGSVSLAGMSWPICDYVADAIVDSFHYKKVD
ncbi:LOW QUALITY PROTEIN: hypothetical protein V2J09_022920, partial [Rumex salicifolius]